WAESHRLDYISFCSLFPSSTADRCEIVRFDTIQNARKMTDIPLFLAGGITPEKMELLQDLDYWGIAVVSGIMLAQNPREELRKFYQEFKK
ncbi:MAG TPA: thiamine phosphate synthase, partial [Membranihabitans sp.]|nr:thiamine phosphate synthase [Membranihabitans sp.]